jgi:hypothetical protein
MIGLICNVKYGRSVMTILIIALIILLFGAYPILVLIPVICVNVDII